MTKSNKPQVHPAVTAYTGDALRVYAAEMGIAALEKRSFVNEIVQYMNGHGAMRCFALIGLKGTGKTTGLLQAIAELDAYDDAVLLCIDANATLSRAEMNSAIQAFCEDVRYVFIDGATNVIDLVQHGRFLLPEEQQGRRMILTGDACMSLAYAAHASLLCHTLEASSMYTPYAASEMDLTTYLREGGRLGSETAPMSFKDYVDTVLVDTMWKSLELNRGASALRDIGTIGNKAKLHDLVCRALVLATVSTIYDEGLTDAQVNLRAMNALLQRTMDVVPMTQPVDTELRGIVDALVYMGVLLRINEGHIPHLYIVQPWLLWELLGILLPAYPEVEVTADEIALKSAVVVSGAQMGHNSRHLGVTYYDAAVPLVVHDTCNSKLLLYGFSASSTAEDTVDAMLKIQAEDAVCALFERPSLTHYVIYMGETRYDAEQGITYVNAEEFLRNTGAYVK